MEEPRYSWNRGSGVMKRYVDEKGGKQRCIFLHRNELAHYYCSVHSVKPELCKIYRTGKPHCYNQFDEDHYYRLLANIENITVDNNYVNVANTRGRVAKIKWRNYIALEQAVEAFSGSLKEYIRKKHFFSFKRRG